MRPAHISRSPMSAIVAVGELRVAHSASIRDCIGQTAAERSGRHDIARDGNDRFGKLGRQAPQLRAAGEDDVGSANPRRRRHDAFSHPYRVDRQGRGLLEDAHPHPFRGGGEPEGIVQRMNAERPRKVHGMEIRAALEPFTHAFRRPYLYLEPELVEQVDPAQKIIAVVDLGYVEPTGDRLDPRHAGVAEGRSDVLDSASDSSHNAFARSNPTRSTMRAIPSAKPGKTKPQLRPEALQAMRWDSSTATDQPRRATSRAAVKPARPPPITQTSTSRSKVSRPQDGLATFVAAYQLEP